MAWGCSAVGGDCGCGCKRKRWPYFWRLAGNESRQARSRRSSSIRIISHEEKSDFYQLDHCEAGKPKTRPGRAPVGLSELQTRAPLTKTFSIPVGNVNGLEKVER